MNDSQWLNALANADEAIAQEVKDGVLSKGVCLAVFYAIREAVSKYDLQLSERMLATITENAVVDRDVNTATLGSIIGLIIQFDEQAALKLLENPGFRYADHVRLVLELKARILPKGLKK